MLEYWATRLFHRLWSLAALRTPLQLTFISCKSSWNVCHQVQLGRPLLLLPPSGTNYIATLAGLSDGSRSIHPASVSLLTPTIFDKSYIPTLFINWSLVTWSRHEMPNMVCKHLQKKTSNIFEIFDIPFHISAAQIAAEITTNLYKCNLVNVLIVLLAQTGCNRW